MNIPRISKTQYNMYAERCPVQYEFRYELGIKEKPAGAMKLGGSVHKAVEHNYIQKADSHKDIPLDEATDYFSQNLKQELEREEVDYDEGETPGTLQDQGVGLVKAHHTVIAPATAPKSKATVEQPIFQLVMVEKLKDGTLQRLHTTLPGFPGGNYFQRMDASKAWAEAAVQKILDEKRELLLAYQLDSVLDLTDDQDRVRELKTAARTPSEDFAHKLVDLTHYDLAYRWMTNAAPKGLAVAMLVKTKDPKALTLPTRRSRAQLEAHLDRIGMMAKAIEHQIFIPRTDWFGCSKRFCGYWDRCPYGGKGAPVIVDPNGGQQLAAQLKESIDRAEEAKSKTQVQGKAQEEGGAGVSNPRPSGGGGDTLFGNQPPSGGQRRPPLRIAKRVGPKAR